MRIPVALNLPQPRPSFKGPIGRWLERGELLDDPSQEALHTHPWHKVLWLTGVDYFSTLGYQPGIALIAAGALAPVATLFLILVTLFGALPVYSLVASRSYAGQGSIAMLESLLSGWKGKLLVLVLLGFAATDFVITMTLSAADAAEHAVKNPILHPLLGDHQMAVTLAALTVLAVVFLRGFKEAIGFAAVASIPFLVLNLAVLARGLAEIVWHPEYLPRWRLALEAQGDWGALALTSLILFPKLALGLSGFETGVTVMPLIDGGAKDNPPQTGPAGIPPPIGRIANTRKLLASAAIIMSLVLALSSFVTTLLIAPQDYRTGGPAAGRAIAFLAHKYMGSVFGSVYDLSTILILGLAGASAMAGLLHLIPRYLPRFGMAPAWVALSRPLVLVLYLVCVVVTVVFQADVQKQSGAYATGVLVLILSAAFAATLDLWPTRRALAAVTGLITLVFLFTLLDNILERPDGIIIGSVFIVLLITLSGVSRSARSTEFRVSKLYFSDKESISIGKEVVGRKVHLVPIRTDTPAARLRKKAEIRKHYRVGGPFLFIHVHLLDNRSEFSAPVEVSLTRDGDDYVAHVHGAIAIANTLAFCSELIDPISIFIGLTRRNLMSQAFRYLLFGEGETGLMLYTILLSYWEWTPEEDVRPLIFLMSD